MLLVLQVFEVEDQLNIWPDGSTSWKVKEPLKLLYFILWETGMLVPNFMEGCPNVFAFGLHLYGTFIQAFMQQFDPLFMAHLSKVPYKLHSKERSRTSQRGRRCKNKNNRITKQMFWHSPQKVIYVQLLTLKLTETVKNFKKKRARERKFTAPLKKTPWSEKYIFTVLILYPYVNCLCISCYMPNIC